MLGGVEQFNFTSTLSRGGICAEGLNQAIQGSRSYPGCIVGVNLGHIFETFKYPLTRKSGYKQEGKIL